MSHTQARTDFGQVWSNGDTRAETTRHYYQKLRETRPELVQVYLNVCAYLCACCDEL